MGKKFEFRTPTVEFDVAGNKFTLPVNAQGVAAVEKWALDAKNLDPDMDNAAVEDFLLDGIDGILGDGAAGQIFAGRTTDYLDALDVLNYIAEEYLEAHNERVAKMRAAQEPAPPNRAGRRAAKKE